MKCDDCYHKPNCDDYMESVAESREVADCGQYFKYVTKGEVMRSTKKQTRAEKDAREGCIVNVYDLKMKPVGRGVVEYVSLASLPKEKQEELRDAGTDVWTRVHMEDGSKLFAFDHYVQFLDDGAHTPEPVHSPHPNPPQPRVTEKPAPKKRGRSVAATKLTTLESWVSRREAKRDE